MKEWYLVRKEKQYGPYSKDDMASFIKIGRIGKSDLIWGPQLDDWAPAEQVVS